MLRIVFASTLALLLAPSVALAHWCDDLWDSSYNIVVKPASDTVTVPASGSATLDLYVQNNMGYPLKNFRFRAEASGYTINSTSTTPKVANYLMPGETLKYTLTISKSGGATLDVISLAFYVNFGNSTSTTQDDYYSGERSSQSGGHPVIVKKISGGLFPASITALRSTNNDQGYYLQNSVNADYLGSPSTGLDGMLGEMLGETDCLVASPNDYDYLDIWAAIGLAVRKSVLGDTRANSLRTQVQCGWADAHPTYKALAAVVLGYLDHDATPNSGVVTFFTNIINDSGSSADDKALAKIGLFLGDGSSYRTDVAGFPASSSLSAQTQMAAAAALGIVDGNDTVVEVELIVRASWTEPATDNGQGLLASHLLDLVAWHQRGWAQYACDTGAVSFYAENAPAGTCGGGGGGGDGGGGGGAASGGCGFGAGGGASLLAILLIFAARRRKT